MDRWRGLVASIAVALAGGLAGCHLTGGMPADLGQGHGRVDRTFPTSLANSVRATLGALDELGVRPKDLSIRAVDAVSDRGKPGWADETNAEYLPDDASFHDLFDRHQLNVSGSGPSPFNPVLVSYKGETEDGRTVSVVVRAQPPDASQTQVMTRVGRDGDEAWGQKFLDRVADQLKGMAGKLPTLPEAGKPG